MGVLFLHQIAIRLGAYWWPFFSSFLAFLFLLFFPLFLFFNFLSGRLLLIANVSSGWFVFIFILFPPPLPLPLSVFIFLSHFISFSYLEFSLFILRRKTSQIEDHILVIFNTKFFTFQAILRSFHFSNSFLLLYFFLSQSLSLFFPMIFFSQT